MVLYDINKAKRIIESQRENFGNTYATMYAVTNEAVKDYSKEFDGMRSTLSVIASGDQALEMISHGINRLELFDINKLAYYFINLKIAAIKTISREDYIKFFIEHDYTYGLNVYSEIRTKLPLNVKTFWDYLISKYGIEEVFNGRLFFKYDIDQTKANLEYFNKDEFNNLKEQIRKVRIDYLIADIQNIRLFNPESYDLIYLSNILEHLYIVKENSIDVNQFLRGFHLNDDGKILCYNLVSSINDFKDNYENDLFGNYEMYSVNNNRDTALIYHKPKGI